MYRQQPPRRYSVRLPAPLRRDVSTPAIVMLCAGAGSAVLVFGVVSMIVDPKAFQDPPSAPAAASAPPSSSPKPSAPPSSSPPLSARVTKAQLGADWPFVHITAGTVRCIPRTGLIGQVIFVADDGRRFGLNGTALDAGVPDIPAGEWRRDPRYPGSDVRVGIGALRDPVAKACGLSVPS